MSLPYLITRETRDAGLAMASEECSHPDAGLFGPGSLLWQVLRENLMSLAQGRLLLLSLAHPRLAQLMPDADDAIQRLNHTQVFLLKLVFGNMDQTLMTLEHPRQRARTLLDVDDASTLLYFLTAWVDSCQLLYEEVIEPLSTAHQERLFEETMLLAKVVGVPIEALPPHWHAHKQWWRQELAKQRPITPNRRRLGHTLIREQGYPGRLPYGAYKPMAAFQVPEHLRTAFVLGSADLAKHRSYQRHLTRLMDLTRRLPKRLRFSPAYTEAMQRLSGRPHADLATRLLNRWWTGESELVSSGWSLPAEQRMQASGT